MIETAEAVYIGSEKISQICVVWRKPVALSRLEPPTAFIRRLVVDK
jgi:hypothetical protein